MKITQAESRKIIVGLILIGIALGCETDGTDDQPEPSIDATILDAQPEVVPSFESLASVANYEESTAGHVSLRRLTRAQYKNAIKALFGPDIDVPKVLEPDVPKAGLRKRWCIASLLQPSRCGINRSCKLRDQRPNRRLTVHPGPSVPV